MCGATRGWSVKHGETRLDGVKCGATRLGGVNHGAKMVRGMKVLNDDHAYNVKINREAKWTKIF